MVKSFRDLTVWQKAHTLAGAVFTTTERFPNGYRSDLTAQLRRAALSVPTNIAEGCATTHTKELLQFINVAQRSVSETSYLLLFAHERGLLEAPAYRHLQEGYDEVGRMLNGLRGALKRRQSERALATNH